MNSGARVSEPAVQVGNAAPSVVSSRVVSPQGARVTETVVVLSDSTRKRLVIQGRIPPR